MKDKENRQFHIRSRGLVAVLAAVLIGFGYVLYDLQIVHGAEYRERSQRKIAQTETVEAARGSLLDRYGRELVTNRTSYNVALETSRMGEDKNAVLLELLDICREQEVEWTDTLPVSAQAPYVFTLDATSDLAVTRLQKLCTQLKWTDLIPTEDEIAAMRPAPAETAPVREEEAEETLPAEPKAPAVSAQPLLDKMKEYFGLDETLPNQEARGLLGVLYELALRSKGITTVSYVFAKDVDIQFITAVKEAGLAGVRIDTKSVRQYRTPYAAHLLGRVGLMDETEQAYYRTLGYDGDESVGKEGVEQAFESWLKGTDGKKAVETNTEGKVISETYKEEPVPGGHVALTLDIRLQEVAERALAEGIAGLKSEDTQGGALVAIDVSDGGVLAMASYPTYDRTTIYSDNEAYNAALNDPLKPFYNRALLGQYAPGSTFKMVTAVGGLEEDIIEPSTENPGHRAVYVLRPQLHPHVLVLPPVRRHPRQRERLGGHPGLLQHLLLRRRPAAGYRPAGPVRPDVRPGGVHRHRAQGEHRHGGRAGRLQAPGADLVRGPDSGCRHRAGQQPVHPPPVGQLYRHPGQRRHPLLRPPAQVGEVL